MSKVVEVRANGSRRVLCVPEGQSCTEQAHAQAADINTIMLRYERSGLLPQKAEGARYGDFSGVVDYHSAVESVRRADEAFMSLDPRVRARFENDPGKLLEFLSDEGNRKEAEDLGLVPVKAVEVKVGDVVEPPVAQ